MGEYEILGRERLQFGMDKAAMALAGNVLLITGAGGSIGSAIARRAASLAKKLVMLDNSESHLFEIGWDLSAHNPVSIIGDIRDPQTIRKVYEEHAPDFVVNAAALKHVGMCETNVAEAILTNVHGAANVLGTARVPFAVQLSTDKAVEPVSAMGCTKALAEIVAYHAGAVIVRLGNVFASSGSMGRIFERQIAERGAVTVTDPNMSRLFMTQEEAADAVLSALTMALASGSSIAVPALNELKITEIARRMMIARGLEPQIIFSAPGPGEKARETLLWKWERPSRGYYDLNLVTESGFPDDPDVLPHIDALIGAARERRIPDGWLHSRLFDTVWRFYRERTTA